MTDADIAARLVEALTREAGAGASLVSVSMEMITAGDVADVSVRVERKTRTLLFLSAMPQAPTARVSRRRHQFTNSHPNHHPFPDECAAKSGNGWWLGCG
jgi:hypothetical protein